MKQMMWLFVLLLMVLISPLTTSASSYSAAGSHAKSLQFLASKGIPDLEKFGRTVTRAEFAMYMVRTLDLPTMTSTRTYQDVATNHPYYAEIQTATAAGIIQGDTAKGTFHPSQPISRIHMVKMLTNALELLDIAPKKVTKPNFNDTKGVSADYAKRIATTYSLGIITGDVSKNTFMPFQQATVAQSATFMTRFFNVVNEANKWYSVANIVSGSYQLDGYYASFDAAKKAMQPGQVLLYKDTVQHMTNGVAYLKTPQQMTIAASRDAMPFHAGTELRYVTSTKQHVTLEMGGEQQAYLQKDVVLIPNGLHRERSYYIVDGGNFIHYVYAQMEQHYEEPYSIGSAPSFAKVGERYYSTDGVHFYTFKGDQAGIYYNYYQFMPLRVASAYSENELNAMITYALTKVAKTNARYKGALETSKLLGLGDTLKEAEHLYQMNAMLLLAIAIYESDYGMHDAAQRQNNLIGTKAAAASYHKQRYATAAENITKMAAYMSKTYVTPRAAKEKSLAYGGVVGTKGMGINTMYTADAFWGANVASIYRELDAAFGAKDAHQNIQMAFIKPVKQGTVNVFEAANTKTIAYQYYAGAPVATHSIQGPYTKITSDDPHFTHVFIPTTALEQMPTHH